MRCPYCSGEETKVVDKRDVEEITRRRRECIACKKRFTTYEKAQVNLIVIKKDGRKEEFSREKLRLGIVKACEKRPITEEQIEAAVDDIESRLMRLGQVESKKIGELVMKKLLKLDEIAYVRFASVYRSFDDVKAFEKEVKMIKKVA
ncbi:MAG: transcriptional repressor NrdR [Candidatus Aenigmarchaeota archaeon]|nr:transcriptional repressor NrdR [Candidatus Aenigmarchaeota archaeon]